MSAPSKEEIAEFISVVRDFSDGSLAAHAVAHLDDENERLRADVDKTQNEFARSARAWTAERDKLMADALMRQTTEITLRADLAAMTASFDEAADHLKRLIAERAECLALLNNIDVAGYKDGLDEWDEKRVALLEKLRGQQP